MLLAKAIGATATKGLHARASAGLRQMGSLIKRTLGSSIKRDSASTEPLPHTVLSAGTEPSLPHTISVEPEPTSTLSEKRLGKSRLPGAGRPSQPIVPRDIARKHVEQLRGTSSKQLSRV